MKLEFLFKRMTPAVARKGMDRKQNVLAFYIGPDPERHGTLGWFLNRGVADTYKKNVGPWMPIIIKKIN